MAGLPLLNSALRVWISDWRLWQERGIGVLLTPWSMSRVCVPGAGGGPGVEHKLRLPSGVYCFVEAEEADIGGFALCSLFSPVFDFADQASAEATAEAALDALFDPGLAGTPEPAADSPPGVPARAQDYQGATCCAVHSRRGEVRRHEPDRPHDPDRR